MSQHRSLKTSKAGQKKRTVLKRYERYSKLKEKGILDEESSVYGMPKLKIVRTKIKKEKAAKEPKEGEVKEEAKDAKKDPKQDKKEGK